MNTGLLTSVSVLILAIACVLASIADMNYQNKTNKRLDAIEQALKCEDVCVLGKGL